MNGMPGHFPPIGGATWTEHRTPDGRVYYYNAMTNVTQWTKPEDMMTPAERALANQPWKEYTAEGGRKYWYNTETKQSSWEMPDVYKRALAGGAGTPTTPATPGTPFQPPGGPSGGYDRGYDRGNDRGYDRGQDRGYDRGYDRDRGNSGWDHHRDNREPLGESRQLTAGPNSQDFISASDEPEYATPQEAEAAFVKVLKRCGVQPEWSWEQALRAIVKDPQYRAIKDPRERKAAFEKYCHDVIIQDKERVKERLAKLRTDFATMLKSHPEIKHYTRWKTARPIVEGETIFRSTNDEAERRQLFDDYIVELKKEHREKQVALRKSAMDGLIDLLPKLDLEPYTRWSEAQGIIQSTAPFQNEEKYQALSKYDILTVFQNHVKALERTFNDSRQQEKNKKHRKERQARDGFKALLSELRKEGKIRAGTKWSQIYSLLENDDRYKAMIGQSGSTPMDLFWDVVEDDERALRGTRNDVLDVIDDKRFEVTPKTTFEEFQSVLKDDRRTANIERYVLELIFERLQEKKLSKRSDDDKHVERQQRRAIDDLRSFMKRLEPPILVTDTYEKVKPRLVKVPEFEAVTSEEARRGAFDKHIRRLKEKEDEAERERRRRDRGDSYHRETRGERSHRTSARPARSSRSPEHDPYEADRRKAIAERERNYRKSSMAESVLTSDRKSLDGHEPGRDRDRERDRVRDRERDRSRDRRDRDRAREPDRDRERRDRDRDYDRRPARRDDENLYDRERRTREEDRERTYRRRVDRDVNELPYGDERPSSSHRRRRADDEDLDRRDSRDPKRLKREVSRERSPHRDARLKSKTPQPVPAKEKSPSVRAGSEEGEIEED
ncbi:hypothetical protein GE09DRAFT_1168059 [Coniochaeta sp. 2T2.1]|nr:hypothetical protein GE09DRAFT_1168059 [Coniochaeta sp. 2T2.1]